MKIKLREMTRTFTCQSFNTPYHRHKTGPEVIKKFMLNSAEHEFVLLINVKMPPSVGILTFMNWKNSVLGLPEPKNA